MTTDELTFKARAVADSLVDPKSLASERALIHQLVADRIQRHEQSLLQERFSRRFVYKVNGERGVSSALLGLRGLEEGQDLQQIGLEAFSSFATEPRPWSRTTRPYDRARQAPTDPPRPRSVDVPAFEYVVCEDEPQTEAAQRRRPDQAGWTWFVGWLFHWPGCAVIKFLEDQARARGDTFALAMLAFRRNVREGLTSKELHTHQ